jgi:hypothetical protein
MSGALATLVAGATLLSTRQLNSAKISYMETQMSI